MIHAVLWVHSCARCQFATVNTDTDSVCPFCGGPTTSRFATA